ncbi:MAG: hypothetical protein E6I62_02230 [Chloroflexi bacterium]|nr:MAG: hypothetical protein E6I62_02230 [Chloroflexota bacterium]
MTKLSAIPIAAACALIAATTALGAGTDVLVSSGSPPAPFSQNKQNEPAIAIDANHPNVLVSGSNDEIDMEACNAGNDTTCPFTQGVGVSGVYFSFDSGQTWTQPTYTGWTGRDCLGTPGADAGCTPNVGSIGTLPWYYENGLVSDGDPAVAFGPKPVNGTFSWANGSRLYYANLTSNFGATRSEEAFKGFEAIAVSRTDNVQSAAASNKAAWMAPVLVSHQSTTTFSDKEQVWADNASASPFFGRVYICWANFVGQEKGNAAPLHDPDRQPRQRLRLRRRDGFLAGPYRFRARLDLEQRRWNVVGAAPSRGTCHATRNLRPGPRTADDRRHRRCAQRPCSRAQRGHRQRRPDRR